MASHPELEFFNSLSGQLTVELDQPAAPIGNLTNLQASPEAQVLRVSLEVEVFDPVTDDVRALTDEEGDRVAFRAPTIRLRGEAEDAVVTHTAPNGSFFTVRDLLRAVEETERQTRGRSEWLGGVDVHHVYFEGIEPAEDGVWEICWGS